MNKLPDELLNPIIAELGTDDASLRSLALVARRYYEPARRATTWSMRGISKQRSFLDLLLSPQLLSFRGNCWRLALTYKNEDPPQSLPLADRLIADIIEKCTDLRFWLVGGIFADERAVSRALVAVGKQSYLTNLEFCHVHNAPLDLPLLRHALPVFSRLESLQLGLDGGKGFHRLPAAHTPLKLRHVSLELHQCTLDEIRLLLRLFVHEAGTLKSSSPIGSARASSRPP